MLFYRLGIYLYGVAIQLSAYFNPKTKLRLEGQKAFQLLNKQNPIWGIDEFVVWFHCASLGEFEQARPLIESIKKTHQKHKVLISFFSPSGYEIQKNYPLADYVTYLPLDTEQNAKEFIQYFKPNIALFIKYEFWYYFIKQCKTENIPFFSISSSFRSNQRFFTRTHKSNDVLKFVNHFFVQNEQSQQLLKSININNVSISGDTRFDRVLALKDQLSDLDDIKQFCKHPLTLVIGSAWLADIEVMKDFLNANNEINIIIAPHEIDSKNINHITKHINKSFVLHSQQHIDSNSNSNILIIDSIGKLKSIYSIASFAYIGGAFGSGLHNILEAATYGKPVIFGNKIEKFPEAIDMVSLGCGFSIKDPIEFNACISKLQDEATRNTLGKIALNFVERKAGASAIILKHLHPYLSNEK
jgi:3-deoxy-D-manno-octulosonic-acid transferase